MKNVEILTSPIVVLIEMERVVSPAVSLSINLGRQTMHLLRME